MRILKILLLVLGVGVALTAGLFVAVIVVAVAGVLSIAYLVGRRLLRRQGPVRPAPASRGRPAAPGAGKVIEVTATEVPLNRPPR